MKKYFLVVSVLFNFLFILALILYVHKKGDFSYIEEKFFDSNSKDKVKTSILNHRNIYSQRVSLFKLLPKSKDDIIFIGNSITSGCEWSEILNNLNVKNRSIGGDNTSGILNRIDEVLESKPRKIFIMAGINDLDEKIESNKILKNYVGMVKHIKSLSPGTKIFIQSILPVNEGYSYYKIKNKSILNLNLEIKKLAEENGITYIDIYSHLLDPSGQLDKRYTNDGLHLLGEGYLVWKEIIEQYVIN